MNNSMFQKTSMIAALVFLFAVGAQAPAGAQGTEPEFIPRPDSLQFADISARLTSFGTDLLGDEIDPHTGSLAFTHTDVSLPGNFDLPVEIVRRRAQGLFYDKSTYVEFADWQLAVPRIHAVSLAEPDFLWEGASRCVAGQLGFEDYEEQTSYQNGVSVGRNQYSQGVVIDVPGRTSGRMLHNPVQGVFPTAAKWVTKDYWYFSCTTASDGGEGFIGHAPNGDKYYFTQLIENDYHGVGELAPSDIDIARYRTILAATQVTDVNGNSVFYDYDQSGRLTKIRSSDNRTISLSYSGTSKLIASVTANGRTWLYTYGIPTNGVPQHLGNYGSPNTALKSVTLPDNSSWSFDLGGMDAQAGAGELCVQDPVTVSVTHPRGAMGTFELVETYHRENATGSGPRTLYCPDFDLAAEGIFHNQPVNDHIEAMSVQSKTLTAPNSPTAVWAYTYEQDMRSPNIVVNEDTNWTRVSTPSGHDTYYHHWSGRLMTMERREQSATGPIIESKSYAYEIEADLGSSFGMLGMSGTEVRKPFAVDSVTQNITGESYQTQYEFNNDRTLVNYSFMKPVKITRSSTQQTNARITDIIYIHDETKWILGLVDEVKRNGKVFDKVTYDSLGRITQHDRFGALWKTYGYHTSAGQIGAPAWTKDALTNQTTFNNYYRGQPQTVTYADSSTVSQIIDDNGWVTKRTDARGNATDYTYNGVGWLTGIVPPKTNGAALDTVITYDISAGGAVQTSIQGNQKVTTNNDGYFRPILTLTEDTTNATSKTYLRNQYDGLGRQTFQSFPSSDAAAIHGVTTKYDALDRLIETKQNVAPFATVTTEYLAGNKVRVTDPRDNATTTTYAGFGSPNDGGRVDGRGDDRRPAPTLVDAPLGDDIASTYDIWGNVLTQTQGSAQTVYAYDNSLRLQSITDPDNYASYTYYDVEHRPVVTIDGAGRKTRMVYDVMDRPEKIIKAWTGANDGTGSTLDCVTMLANYNLATGYLQQCYQLYSYTPTGQIETVTDAKDNLTSYAYDALDRLTDTYFPTKTVAGQSSTTDFEKTTYNGLSHPVSKKTRGGDTIAYTFDALGRLTDRTVPGAPTHSANGRTVSHSFTYDAWGNPLTAVHDGETLSYQYDAIGRVESQSHDNALPVSYVYDAANNLTKLTYPDGWAVDFDYDARNRVEAANDNNGSSPRELASIAYDTRSRRKSVTYANGASAHFGYTNRGNLTCHDWNLTGATPANCNTGSPEIAYDFTHNGVGQLLTKAVSDDDYLWAPAADATDIYQSNGLNQYTNVAGANPAYDGNGNLTTDHAGLSFIYDAENVLRTASGLAGGTATYRYSADGARREKSYNGEASQFYYMGGLGYLDQGDTQFAADQEIAEYSGGALTRRYLRLPGSVDETFLMIDYTLNGACNDNDYAACERWSHQDRLGSIVAVSDSAGSVAASDKYVYSPYGVSGPEGNGGFPFRFTGQKLDAETGLYYYKARYYDPETGRFLQTDSIGYEDQMNLYAYVGNDPINLTDPLGLAGCGDMVGQGLSGECIDSSNFREEDTHKKNGKIKKQNNKLDEDAVGTTETDTTATNYAQATNQTTGKEQGARIDGAATTPITADKATSSSMEFQASEIAGADAMVHTHPTNKNEVTPGKGDWQATQKGVPNYVAHGERVVVVEVSGGQVRVRVVNGSLTKDERKQIRRRVNEMQRKGTQH